MNPDIALPSDIAAHVAFALNEDVGSGDISARLIPAGTQAQATVYCREEAVLCGTPWVNEVFHQVDASVQVEWFARDGDAIGKDQALFKAVGDARALLTKLGCFS